MRKTFSTIFKQPLYLLIASFVALAVFSIALWMPNFALIYEVLLSDTAGVLEKASFVLSLYGSIITNFTIASASYTILIAVLFGVHIALLVFYIRTRRVKNTNAQSVGWLGMSGVISGFLGVGCAACGSLFVSSVLTASGAGVLLFLPFGGKEFGYFGVGILAYAIYSLSKKIKEPLICS